MPPQVLTLDDPAWASFVSTRREATPFHHPTWAQMLADCYGFHGFAFVVPDDAGRVVGGLPVLETRRPRSRSWVSLPFTDMCEPLGDDPARVAVAFDKHRREAGIARCEIRAAGMTAASGRSVLRGVLHTLDLDSDPDVVRRTFDRSQVQRSIARAEREGVIVREGTRRPDLLETFYALHLATRRRQGVPIQSKRFFELLWERMLEPGRGSVLIAEHDGRAVAAAVFLSWNGHLIYKFGASDPAHRACRPNHAILWHAIRRACEGGDRVFHFGRTDIPNLGLRRFKSGWGAFEAELAYTTFGLGTPERAHGRRVLSSVIRHSPQWVCRVLGEHLYRLAA